MATALGFEADILHRVIRPEEPMFSEDAAKAILRLSFAEEDRQRMAQLATKAREGSLTSDEHLEADSYERVSSLLGILKSKARRSLRSCDGET
jgi:hypothetical protein